MNRSLRGRASKIVAALQVNAGTRPSDRMKCREAMARGAALSPWRPTHEPVLLRAKRKSGGGERPYYTYGWANQVLQKQVGHAIKQFLPRDDRCYLQRGVPQAVEKVVGLIRENDKRWVIEADISNFYPSIRRDEIARLLPVDGRITNVVITSESMNWKPTFPRFMRGLSTAMLALTALRGLPQGASTSPAVADAFVARQLSKLPRDFAVVNYGDNFLIGGKTKREALQKFEALVAAFRRCSGTQFVIACKQLRRCDQGFTFLGYNIKVQRNRTSVCPKASLLIRTITKIDRILSIADGEEGPRRVWRVVFSHLGAMSLWKCARNWLFHILQSLSGDDVKRRYMASMSVENLKRQILIEMGIA